MKNFIKQIVCLLMIAISFFGCDFTQRDIDEVLKIQSQGNFLHALYRFRDLQKSNPDDPRIQAYLGNLLTLESLASRGGIQMMTEALLHKDIDYATQEFICREIYFFYLSLRQHKSLQQASRQYSELCSNRKTNQSTNDINTTDAAIALGLKSLKYSKQRIHKQLRSLALKRNNLNQQSEKNLKKISLAAKMKSTEYYYLLLSYVVVLSQKYPNQNDMKKLIAIYHTLPQQGLSDEQQCRFNWITKKNLIEKYEIITELKEITSKIIKDCQDKFPGVIALHRDINHNIPYGWKLSKKRYNDVVFDKVYQQIYNLDIHDQSSVDEYINSEEKPSLPEE